MNRKAKYAINGAIAGTLISALVNALKQLNKMDENPEKKFDWGDLLVAGGKGALIGGGAGFVAGAIVDEVNVNTKAINTDEYLNAFVCSVQVNKNSKLYKSSEKKCEEIIHFLGREFKYELSDVPFQWGSNAKGTAIEGKSDFDIMVRFCRDSFTLKEMYYSVLEVFEEKFRDNAIVEVIDQKKSVGLVFNLQGEKVRIDVVPMRDINDSPKNTASNLYVNNKGLFSKPTFTKTNIPLQASIRLTSTQKKIIIILKKWKVDNNVPISSYMIQLFLAKAYDRNRNNIPRKLTDKLLMVLEFIVENIHTIRFTSPENTNNIVSNIPEEDKNSIRRKALKVIEEYEYHPNTIPNLFVLENI
jgi:hypothetical protein